MSQKLLEHLTKNITQRDIGKENALLIEKWNATGLLEGLEGQEKVNMSILLENQAKELIRESSTMAAGDVAGFASVAFPMVRRIQGKAIATKLVSVQPMSMPAGLIFFLDFVYDTTRLGNTKDTSIYGGGRVGSQVTGGVLIEDETTVSTALNSGPTRYGERGFYANNNGYSSATGTLTGLDPATYQATFMVNNSSTTDKTVFYDPDLASGSYAAVYYLTLTAAQKAVIAGDDLTAIVVTAETGTLGASQVRRLTHWNPTSSLCLNIVYHATATFASLASANTFTIGYPRKDNWQTPHLGAIVGTSAWEMENRTDIPEINIKVDSISVTAQTKKLKAVWTPELAQDLNAFHNVDSEVELTGILSDQVELEINAELLTDLCKGATAGTYYWSRRPGKFLNRATGAELSSDTAPPDFTGTVFDWYETLMEVINDMSAKIYRKVRKGGANFIVCNPEVCAILESTNGYRANGAVDDETGDAGIVKSGSLSRKWDLYIDPNFPRNVILVGRKGKSFLESGYAYCPYVPLQASPTVVDPDSFVPRKAISTRYAKQMVRPDYYGLVIVTDLMG